MYLQQKRLLRSVSSETARLVGLCSVLVLAAALASAAEPTPVPAANANGVTVGPGFVEQSVRQVVRTHGNIVYAMTADDAPCQIGGRGVIHIWKGVGAQPGNSNVPTSFVEQDAANRPVSAGSGSCIFALGISAMLASPEIRLDSADLIHIAYMDGNNGSIYYQTYSTVTDTWGARTVVGTGGNTNSGNGWPRTGQVSLSLDVNDAPHIVYASAGSSNSLRYVNKVSGSWSSPVTLATGTNIMHPSMVPALDGTLHAVWLNNSIAAHSSVGYARRDVNGVWSNPEVVTAGDSNVLANSNNDQGPSVLTDRNNLPFVLYLDGAVNASDNYVRMRYRASTGAWTDNTPPGAPGGASNPNGTWYTHSPQAYCAQSEDVWIFLGHDADVSPAGYEYQVGGPGNPWSAYSTLDPRNRTTTTAGAAGLDGSASVRFDPLRDNNPGIIDVLYYDESDGTAGYDHHATVYYKAIALNSVPDTTRPSAPANVAAVANSATQITVSWTPSTDNIAVSGYRVFRDGVQVATSVTTSYIDGGLAPATTYTYSVSAFDSSGNTSILSESAAATTAAPDTAAPSVPSNLVATPVSSSAIRVSWSASTDNVAVTGYRVFRNGVQIASTSATSYSDTGLLPATSYSYTVSAFDAAGNVSAQSTAASAVTLAAPATYTMFGSSAPVTADHGSDSSIEVGVKFTSEVAGQITAIRFYKSARNTGTHVVALWSSAGKLLANATATGETASGWQTAALSSPVAIAANTLYVASYHAPRAHYPLDSNYFSSAYNKAPLHAPVRAGVYAYGSASMFPTQSGLGENYWVDVVLSATGFVSDTTPPSAPAGLAAKANSSSSVTLTWTAATDNTGVAGYTIYRGGSQIGSTTATSYSDSGLTAGSTYTYTVGAYDAAENKSPQSAPASVTLPAAADTTPPSLSAISASSITASSASVTWVTNEPATTQAEYGPTSSYGASTTLNTVLATAHTASISGLAASTTYHYRAKSSDAAGNLAVSGDYVFTTSALVDATAPSVSLTAPDNAAVLAGVVSVTASATDNVKVTKVEFYLDGVLQSSTTTSPSTWSFNTAQSANGAHTLLAKAYDAAGNAGASGTVTVTVSNTTAPSIMLAQSASVNVAATAQASLTLSAPVTAGDLLVVAVSIWPSSPAATAITDSLGNTFSAAGTTRKTSGGAYTGIYYAKAAIGGADTIVFHAASGNSELSMIAAEFTGTSAAKPLDASGGAAGSGITASSGNLTPTAAGDLLIGAGTHDSTNTTSAGSGFTMIAVTNENAYAYQPLAMDYKILTTTSPAAATLTLATSDQWAQAGALFKR